MTTTNTSLTWKCSCGDVQIPFQGLSKQDGRRFLFCQFICGTRRIVLCWQIPFFAFRTHSTLCRLLLLLLQRDACRTTHCLASRILQRIIHGRRIVVYVPYMIGKVEYHGRYKGMCIATSDINSMEWNGTDATT